MTALYRSGRQGDALGLYRETRSLLTEEQGTEPGPALADLHQRILRGDPELSVTSRRPGVVAEPDTLPPDTMEFVGRGQELALLTGQPGGTPGAGSSRACPASARPRSPCTPPAPSPRSTRTGCSTSTCTRMTPEARRSI